MNDETIMAVRCGNAKHPCGPWHTATPLPASWQWAERLRQWLRRRSWGCGCAPLISESRWPYPIHDVDPDDPNSAGCTCTCEDCKSGICHAKARR